MMGIDSGKCKIEVDVLQEEQVSILRKYAGKMLFPYPADGTRGIVLISREPEFAFLGNNIEDLSGLVCKIRIPALFSRTVDVKLKETRSQELNPQLAFLVVWG